MKTLNVKQFFQLFPDDDACLEHLFKSRFGASPACPKCGQTGLFRKLSSMPAYTCNCGHHIHPMVGTPFENSRTPLQKWFYAMYLFTTSRHGVSAKELERQLGVTYKCAYRIAMQIRKYMGTVNGGGKLSGTVEVDEAYIGGTHKGKAGRGASGKAVVLGMMERDGKVATKVVKDAKRKTLQAEISGNVEKGSEIHSDGWMGYDYVAGAGYSHKTVNHSKAYASNGVHVNSVEGFWSLMKRSIKSTHIHVSGKHLDKYLGEFEYRYNMRKQPELMFTRLVEGF